MTAEKRCRIKNERDDEINLKTNATRCPLVFARNICVSVGKQKFVFALRLYDFNERFKSFYPYQYYATIQNLLLLPRCGVKDDHRRSSESRSRPFFFFFQAIAEKEFLFFHSIYSDGYRFARRKLIKRYLEVGISVYYLCKRVDGLYAHVSYGVRFAITRSPR